MLGCDAGSNGFASLGGHGSAWATATNGVSAADPWEAQAQAAGGPPQLMVPHCGGGYGGCYGGGDCGAAAPLQDDCARLLRGHWLDSIGNSIIVGRGSENEHEMIAVVTPLADHSEAADRVLTVRQTMIRQWRCGNATLLWAEEHPRRLIWATDDGRRCVWTRPAGPQLEEFLILHNGAAFPWLLNNADPEPWLPLNTPRDILHDAARVAALLDIRQMIGAWNEPQERLTHILMDYDLHPGREDYLIPGHKSPIWDTLLVSEALRTEIKQRIKRIPQEVLAQSISWKGSNEIWVGHHTIFVRDKDIRTLETRWCLPTDERKHLEVARLLALYSVLDNPMSSNRSGLHLGLDPNLRVQCDFELFASPLNAEVPNGQFASKWPHVEWRFGSMGSYPSVLPFLPRGAVVCVNPPFTDEYLTDVMSHLEEIKGKFRLRIAVPVQDAPWRGKLYSALPRAQVLSSYYDSSDQKESRILHPTLLWEDPRCPSLYRYPVNTDSLGFQESGQAEAAFFPEYATGGMAASAVPYHDSRYVAHDDITVPG